MVLNALLAALISYTLNVLYNLLNGRELKTVFNSGIRFFALAFLITAALQLMLFFYRDYAEDSYAKTKEREENSDGEKMQSEENREAEAEKEAKNEAEF